MPEETLKEALDDIRSKLRAGDYYRNEEHVRLSLVTRVLKEPRSDLVLFDADEKRFSVFIHGKTPLNGVD